MDTSRNWEERKICLQKVYFNMDELIAEAKTKVGPLLRYSSQLRC